MLLGLIAYCMSPARTRSGALGVRDCCIRVRRMGSVAMTSAPLLPIIKTRYMVIDGPGYVNSGCRGFKRGESADAPGTEHRVFGEAGHGTGRSGAPGRSADDVCAVWAVLSLWQRHMACRSPSRGVKSKLHGLFKQLTLDSDASRALLFK